MSGGVVVGPGDGRHVPAQGPPDPALVAEIYRRHASEPMP
jgi:hypothetical protein